MPAAVGQCLSCHEVVLFFLLFILNIYISCLKAAYLLHSPRAVQESNSDPGPQHQSLVQQFAACFPVRGQYNIHKFA